MFFHRGGLQARAETGGVKRTHVSSGRASSISPYQLDRRPWGHALSFPVLLASPGGSTHSCMEGFVPGRQY